MTYYNSTMKKILFLLLSSTVLSSCAYPSFYEAQYDCAKWVKDGGTYNGVIKAIAETKVNINLLNLFIYSPLFKLIFN